MRKLILLAGLCIAFNLNAQRTWVHYQNNCPIVDAHDWMNEMQYDDEFSVGIDYRPDMSFKESRKTRKAKKRLRKARKKGSQLAEADFKIIPDRENLKVMALINSEKEEAYHIKLTNRKGKVIQSYLHLSPQTMQEIKLMQLMPGKYQLSLYAGIERRLITRYDVNRY